MMLFLLQVSCVLACLIFGCVGENENMTGGDTLDPNTVCHAAALSSGREPVLTRVSRLRFATLTRGRERS